MSCGVKLAYVLRAKGGRSLLVRTNGLPSDSVHDAATNAVTLLAKFAAAEGKEIQDGSGDSPPTFALGRLTVSQGRYAVTYRMVNAILVLVVSEPDTNPLTCLRAVDAAAKVLVAACKGPDVTAEKMIKRYLDVYTMLGDILDGGLDSLPPAFAHISATDERLMGLPSSSADVARRVKRMLGPGGKSSTFSLEKASAGGEGTEPQAPSTPTRDPTQRAALIAAADPLADVMFDIPADALPPPPARALGAPRRPPPPAASSVPVALPSAFKGALPDEDLKKSEQEGFGAFQPPELMEAEKAAAEQSAEDAAQTETDEGPVAPGGPVVTEADALEALMLIELWRGEGRGDRIVKAGIEGAVRRRLAPYGLSKVKFRVTPSETPVVNALMQVANMNKEATKKDSPDGLFTALLAGAPMSCSYLTYTLPAVACRPPLLAELIIAPPIKPPKAGAPWQYLIVVKYVVNPELSSPLLDVVFDVQLPPEVCTTVSACPEADWAEDQGRLRWEVDKIAPGESGMVRAIMGSRKDVAGPRAEEALAQVATARVTFTGWPTGKGPSGLGFKVGMPQENKDLMQGKVLWFGELTLRPTIG